MLNRSDRRADASRKTLVVALAGNPNSGKTTIFNCLTGGRQHVANYPGVTVDKVEGFVRHGGEDVTLVDLPGAYSLTAFSAEEAVARDFVLRGDADAVAVIVDSSNIERHLAFAVQVLEMGVPAVVALNMFDLAEVRGVAVDVELLSRLLGCPVIPTVGHKGGGLTELMDAALVAARAPRPRPLRVEYGEEIESEVERLVEQLSRGATDPDAQPGPARWVAVKLLEGDAEIGARYDGTSVGAAAAAACERLGHRLGEDPEVAVADQRHGFAAGACREAVRTTAQARRNMSDQIDRVVLSPLVGLPLFLLAMYLVFTATFTLGGPMVGLVEAGFSWLRAAVAGAWNPEAAPGLRSLVLDGVIGGVGSVVTFLPNILFLFLAIAFLEASGYMARGAFIMDRLMHRMGLHGKSFIPLLVGFGCSVPAILSTRILESRRDRLTTMLVVPLMSCGGRLPIYALMIPAFFPPSLQGPVLWLIYLVGILLAVGLARLLRSTLLRGESHPFVMELPPYRLPPLALVLAHTWERARSYLMKAATAILGFSVILWALTTYPRLADPVPGLTHEETHAAALEHSAAGRIGHVIEPVLKPIGFDWKIGTALIGALAMKEVFVAQMGIVYSVGDSSDNAPEALRHQLRDHYRPLTGLCIMLFCLISSPCVATVACVARESGSWKWALLQVVGLTTIAWLFTFVVYQTGSLLGF